MLTEAGAGVLLWRWLRRRAGDGAEAGVQRC